MRNAFILSLLSAALVLSAGVQAQKKPTEKKPSGNIITKPGGAMMAQKPASGATKITGFAKGKPSGTTFTLGARGGPYTVDASKAKVIYQGKAFEVSAIKPGSSVSVSGAASGKTIAATDVKVNSLPGDRKPGAAPGKMKGGGVTPKG